MVHALFTFTAIKALMLLQDRSSSEPDPQALVDTLPSLLYGLLLLLVILVFGGYAIVLALRRFRDTINVRRPTPTDITDIWSMHKLPESDDENKDEQRGQDDCTD